MSPDYIKAFNEHIQTLSTDGPPVGQKAIALANVCHQEVYIYITYLEPLIYTAIDGKISGVPITLAFYEPGHYGSVLNLRTVGKFQI